MQTTSARMQLNSNGSTNRSRKKKIYKYWPDGNGEQWKAAHAWLQSHLGNRDWGQISVKRLESIFPLKLLFQEITNGKLASEAGLYLSPNLALSEMLRFWIWPRPGITENEVATWKVVRESIVDRATEKFLGPRALKFRQAFMEILVGNNPTQHGQPTKAVQLSFEDLLHVQKKKKN